MRCPRSEKEAFGQSYGSKRLCGKTSENFCAANRVYAAREKVFMGFKDGRPAVCIDLQTAGRCMFLQRAPRPKRGAAFFSDRDGLKNFVGKKIHDADL